ncbi:unnamed protein product, partial [Polarella glacialis]
LDELGITVLGGIGFSLLLLIILMLDAGKYLIRCRPDDFMRVVVAMNSTMIVVVSIPFFVISFCFLHSTDTVMDEEEAGAEDPGLGLPAAHEIGRGIQLV